MKDKRHVVFFSGGLGSWKAFRRVISKYGADKTYALFTDTLIEDEDLYRFIVETLSLEYGVEAFESKSLIKSIPKTSFETQAKRKKYLSNLAQTVEKEIPNVFWRNDGRDVWDIFFDEKMLGNSRLARCSHVIKQDLAKGIIEEYFDPSDTILYLGIDWMEEHRTKAPKKNWSPYEVRFPMCEEPLETNIDHVKDLEELGIKVPRLYTLGFSHNNCHSGDTEFITKEGVRKLKDSVGDKIEVLSDEGKWYKATVRPYGKQELYSIVIKNTKTEKEFIERATKDHRWFIEKDGEEKEVITKELRVGDLLIEVEEGKRNTSGTYRIESVSKTGKVEDVFCPYVPIVHSFALSNGIKSGNCGGFCVRAGQGHFINLLEQRPELFDYHEKMELLWQEKTGKPYTILRKQRNKVRYNITLKELREEYEAKRREADIDFDDIGGCGCFVNYEADDGIATSRPDDTEELVKRV